MDKPIASTLLRSFLERCRGEDGQPTPPFRGLVSPHELQALELLVTGASAQVVPAPGESETMAVAIAERSTTDEVTVPPVPVSGPSLACGPRIDLDLTALRLKAPENSSITLCLDFGTARSKAFAATALDEDVGKLFDLAVGKEASESNAIYSVTSSVWIDRDGRLYVGEEAVRRSLFDVESSATRQRLDSLKQEISQTSGVTPVEQRQLSVAVNPTGVPLTVQDAITMYLAYLTDMSTGALASQHGGPRYVRRRFALPCWGVEHRLWAARILSTCLRRAVLLADTFRGRWSEGIPTEVAKELLTAAADHDEALGYLIHKDGPPDRVAHYGGVLEPLAAGSARLWKDEPRSLSRQLVLVLDVGAGTTDLSLFWVVQQPGSRKALPIAPAASAIRMAGDQLDSALLFQLKERAHLGGDETLQRRVHGALALEMRRLKEQLFKLGEVRHRLVNDQVVHITLEDFLASEGVRNFTATLHARVQEFLGAIHPSWFGERGADGIKMLITGGGCELPMIVGLASREWAIGDRDIRPTLASKVPAAIQNTYTEAFVAEYPQLAVAIGGALPSLLDEGNQQTTWLGGTPPPQGLNRYQVTGPQN